MKRTNDERQRGWVVIRMCRYHIGPSYIQGYNSWVGLSRNDRAVILNNNTSQLVQSGQVHRTLQDFGCSICVDYVMNSVRLRFLQSFPSSEMWCQVWLISTSVSKEPVVFVFLQLRTNSSETLAWPAVRHRVTCQNSLMTIVHMIDHIHKYDSGECSLQYLFLRPYLINQLILVSVLFLVLCVWRKNTNYSRLYT